MFFFLILFNKIIPFTFTGNVSLACSITVCNAGFHKKGSTCVLCPDNKIKSSPGNASECEITCDGESNVPNDAHTKCGKTVLYRQIDLNYIDIANYI